MCLDGMFVHEENRQLGACRLVLTLQAQLIHLPLRHSWVRQVHKPPPRILRGKLHLPTEVEKKHMSKGSTSQTWEKCLTGSQSTALSASRGLDGTESMR
jgi:hypothetical protein